MRGFLNGVVFTLAVLAGSAFVAVWEGVLPSGADNKPSKLERWAANKSLGATINREDKALTNPLQPTDANLIDGVHLYGANCAVCHGASDAQPSTIAQGFYIHAPQLAKHGVEDDSEPETFWKLTHGIRFSAMPSFAATLSDEERWKLTMLLARMDKLPAAVELEWKKVPSVAGSPAPVTGSPAP